MQLLDLFAQVAMIVFAAFGLYTACEPFRRLFVKSVMFFVNKARSAVAKDTTTTETSQEG